MAREKSSSLWQDAEDFRDILESAIQGYRPIIDYYRRWSSERMTMSVDVLSQFERKRGDYERFVARLQQLIEQLLADRGIVVHSVTSRAKSRESLASKLQRKRYSDLSDITDIAALRITTYFSDQVSLVSEMIESQFVIDTGNSSDKSTLLDPDRFGYLSIHYVVQLSQARATLPEYNFCRSLKAEIQVRSILQHAWAEIEHDLGYKSSISIPTPLRRRFSRLAGMLEVVDSEFVAIRDALFQYQQSIATTARADPDGVEINKVSLELVYTTNPAIRELDEWIAQKLHARYGAAPTDLDFDLRMLGYFSVADLGCLLELLERHSSHVRRLAEIFGENDKREEVSAGTAVFYLGYALAGTDKDEAALARYLENFHIGTAAGRPSLVKEIRRSLESA